MMAHLLFVWLYSSKLISNGRTAKALDLIPFAVSAKGRQSEPQPIHPVRGAAEDRLLLGGGGAGR
jgi:hypothetical protein